MRRTPFVAIIVITGCLTLTWAGSKGTSPRSDASKYPAHTEQSGTVSLGVRLLTHAEVRKNFVSNLNECCMVVELAVFPDNGKSFPVSLNDISMRIAGTDTSAKAASATLVSATLQKTARQERDITVSPVSSVGYESGSVYGPGTRNSRHSRGVYTSAGVGVGVGQLGDQQPGASDKDRAVIETELAEKGLPEGVVTAPVAGYLYFPLVPKKKNTKYQLQYTMNGETLNLALE